jgi:hypothetical protein
VTQAWFALFIGCSFHDKLSSVPPARVDACPREAREQRRAAHPQLFGADLAISAAYGDCSCLVEEQLQPSATIPTRRVKICFHHGETSNFCDVPEHVF